MLGERAKAEVEELDAWAADHLLLIKNAWLACAIPGGDWPDAELLTRELFKSHQINVESVARTMPPALGRLADGRLVLTVRGANYYGGAKRHLRQYFQAVRLAVKRFGEPAEKPIASTDDLVELGFDPEWSIPLFERVLEGEWWALSPAGNEGDGRLYRLNQNAALALARVRTLPKYLEAQANVLWPDIDPLAPRLHPLMNEAFGRDKPRIVITSRHNRSGLSIQRGIHLLSQGIVAAIRNPTAHGANKLTDAEAVECLAAMSFVYRHLDGVESAARPPVASPA